MFKKHKIAFGLAVLGLLSIAGVAFANPTYIGSTVQTSSATSTPAYMTSGTATSTLTYDSYAPSTASTHFSATKAGLALQFSASSTATVLNISYEYSNDGIDWYRNFVIDPNGMGTSTTPYSLATAQTTSWKFASTSVNGQPIGALSNLSTAFVMVPTPTRYVRAVFTLTGGNGAIWAQFVPTKEVF